MRFDKRLTHGLNVMVSYTYSKWMDSLSYLNAQDPITQTPERTLDATATPTRVVLSGNWALPVFAHTRGILGVFLHGWQANGIFSRENGFPLAAPAGYYSAGIDPSLPNPIDQQYFNTCTLLTSGASDNCKNLKTGETLPVAFIQQLPNTLRTLSGRFPSIRPPRPNADCFVQGVRTT